MFDITIVGAGIIGCQLAYDLSRFNVSVLVLEKNGEVLNEISSANSGIIHPGYDPEDGTLKARLNLLGASLYPQLCADLHVDYRQVGSLVVASREEELESLRILLDRARRRNIQVRWLNHEEALKEEPHLNPAVVAALFFPTTGMLLPWEMGYALIDHACANGVTLLRQAPLTRVTKQSDGVILHTPQGDFETRCVVNCAGLGGETVARLNRPDFPKSLVYRKGQYQVSDKTDEPYLNHIVFPVPSAKGKGVLAVKTTEGNLLFGPTSEPIEDGYDFSTTLDGLAEIDRKIPEIIQPLPKSHMIRQFAGVRPSPIGKDFILEEDGPGWINAIGIDSPGLASAPGISRYILDNFLAKHFELLPRSEWIRLPRALRLNDYDQNSWNTRIHDDPAFGRIVCICEQVSEGEILEAIRKPAGARSIKGVKRRVRPGSGRCQGGFCENRVVALLARELGIEPTEVVYDDTPFLSALGDER